MKFLTLQELRDLLRRLLVKKPAMRLGAQKNGAADVKSHPWFEGFDWNAFQKLELSAPYVPKVLFRIARLVLGGLLP